MAAFANDSKFQAERVNAKLIFDTLQHGSQDLWAAEKSESISDSEALNISAMTDLKAINGVIT